MSRRRARRASLSAFEEEGTYAVGCEARKNEEADTLSAYRDFIETHINHDVYEIFPTRPSSAMRDEIKEKKRKDTVLLSYGSRALRRNNKNNRINEPSSPNIGPRTAAFRRLK